jgi:hypothetical protein
MVPGISPSSGNGEYLVILNRESAPETLAALSAQFRVTQVVSPRVVIVSTGPGEHPPPASLPGVLAATNGELNPMVAATLDETEMLFAAAWASRVTGPPKQRKGEGLSWDSPGFLPPDPPAGRS